MVSISWHGTGLGFVPAACSPPTHAPTASTARACWHLAPAKWSGNTGAPHLHIHAQSPGPAGAPWGGDPQHIEFNGRFPVRGERMEVQ